MKYSSFCNEGCIDLNSSTLLKASASASEKTAERTKGILRIIFLYFISTEHLY